MPNIGLDLNELAKSVAKAVSEDGKKAPICFSERTADFSSPFCSNFYREYQTLLGNTDQPTFNQVVQYIYITFPNTMKEDFLSILNNLSDEGYRPDSFITFSENVFTIINSVSKILEMRYCKKN